MSWSGRGPEPSRFKACCIDYIIRTGVLEWDNAPLGVGGLYNHLFSRVSKLCLVQCRERGPHWPLLSCDRRTLLVCISIVFASVCVSMYECVSVCGWRPALQEHNCCRTLQDWCSAAGSLADFYFFTQADCSRRMVRACSAYFFSRRRVGGGGKGGGEGSVESQRCKACCSSAALASCTSERDDSRETEDERRRGADGRWGEGRNEVQRTSGECGSFSAASAAPTPGECVRRTNCRCSLMMSGSERSPVSCHHCTDPHASLGGGQSQRPQRCPGTWLLREPVCLFKVSAQLSGTNPEAEPAYKLTLLAALSAQA